MKYQFDNPPTREAMIEEFGADVARLIRAEESIRNCAVEGKDFDPSKQFYTKGEVAHVLIQCGIAEAFALFCVRLGGTGGHIEILPTCMGPPLRGMLHIRAVFDTSGNLETMEGCVDTGEPFGLGIDYMVAVPAAEILSDAWRENWRKEIGNYEAGRKVMKIQPPAFLVTVVRYPLSRPQAYRKFVSERWFDPDVAPMERFECPLDRVAFERFEAEADSVSERFERQLESADRKCP